MCVQTVLSSAGAVFRPSVCLWACESALKKLKTVSTDQKVIPWYECVLRKTPDVIKSGQHLSFKPVFACLHKQIVSHL